MIDEGAFNVYFYTADRKPKSGSLHTFFEYVPGGLEGLLNFLAMAAGEETDDGKLGEALALAESCLSFRRAHWETYENRKLYWEKICETVGVSAFDFRMAVMKQVDLYCSHLSHLQSIGALPDLVKSSISAGLIPSDKTFKDREAHFKHTKYIPQAPGLVVNSSNNVNVGVQTNLSLSAMPSFEALNAKAMAAIRAEEPSIKMLEAQSDDWEEGAIEVAKEETDVVYVPNSRQ